MSEEKLLPTELLDRIVNKIRSKDVVLWTGAGFNHSAGLPTGYELAEAIKESCTESERKKLNEKGPALQDIAEEFINLRSGSRKELEEIVRKCLELDSPNLEIHNCIKKILQIDTIITTNYDDLFEQAFGHELDVIYDASTFSKMKRNARRKYFKIHGDIWHSEYLVISKTDYLKFEENCSTSVLWNEIRSIISKSTIVFAGYGLHDGNVQAELDWILKQLAAHKSECFFISPQIEDVQNKYLKKNHITPVEATAKDAFNFISEKVKYHMIDDLKKGLLSVPDVLPMIKKEHGMKLQVKTNEDGCLEVTGINVEPNHQLKGTMQFKVNSDDPDELKKILSGDLKKIINIPAEDIVDAKIEMEGFKLSHFGKGEGDILICPAGTSRFEADLIGQEGQKHRAICFAEIESRQKWNIKIEHPALDVHIFNDKENGIGRVQISLPQCPDPWDGMSLANFAIWWVSGGSPTFVNTETGQVGRLPADLNHVPNEKQMEFFKQRLNLYELITKLSQFYSVTLSIPWESLDEHDNDLDVACLIMRNDEINTNSEILLLRIAGSFNLDEFLQENIDENGIFTIKPPIVVGGKLFGNDIIYGLRRIRASSVFVDNREEVESCISKGDTEIKLILKCSKNELFTSFEKPENLTELLTPNLAS